MGKGKGRVAIRNMACRHSVRVTESRRETGHEAQACVHLRTGQEVSELQIIRVQVQGLQLKSVGNGQNVRDLRCAVLVSAPFRIQLWATYPTC